MQTGDPPQYAIASVDKALQLVLLLRDQRDEWFRVSEIADELGVARSTAHRLLAMLVYRGFARQDSEKLYGAGAALIDARLELGTVDLRSVARPHLEALSSRHNETVHLVTLEGGSVVFLDSVEGSQALKVGSRAGAHMPAHLNSGGRAMLAARTPHEVEKLVDLSGDKLAEFHDLLATVRRRGYAVNLGETERGICAIGVAVHSGDRIVGAISLSAPSLRLPSRRVAQLAPSVRQVAAAISKELRIED